MTLDAHGQPKNRAFNAARINDRVIDELIGVCRGVLADGEVKKSEAKFLIDWMDSNRQAAEQWPARVLYPRIQEMLSDSVLDPQEEGELMDLLVEITGGNANVVERVASLAGTLPLDDPAADIHFEGKSFCFTGRCVAGPRKKCASLVIQRGGEVTPRPTQSLDYLVIGLIGSTDWIHSTQGRKIEKTMEFKEKGCAISIVSEEHWAGYIT